MNNNSPIITLPSGTVTAHQIYANFERSKGAEIVQNFDLDVTINRVHYVGHVYLTAYKYKHQDVRPARFVNTANVHRGDYDWGNITDAASQRINDEFRDAGLLDAFNDTITPEFLASELRSQAERELRSALRTWHADMESGAHWSGVSISRADLVDIIWDLDVEGVIKDY